jgi:hypothetical protein
MRAKFIYEKFSDTSDPVHDMGIGGINPSIKFEELRENFIKEWIDYMKQFKLIGKKITGELRKGSRASMPSHYTTGIIKSVKFDPSLESQYIHFTDENNANYYYMIKDKVKFFIEDES